VTNFEVPQLYQGKADEWDTFIAGCHTAHASHLYAWKSVIESVYQHECPYLVVRQDQAIAGVLPLVDVRSRMFGRQLVSMPYLNRGGPIGAPHAMQHLVRAALEMSVTRHVKALEFRCSDPASETLACAQDKVRSFLKLPNDAEQLWTQLPSKLRSQIRRAQKAGITVRFGAEQIDGFFSVFARNMRDLGSPTHPKRFFEAIARYLGKTAWFACAYLGDHPVAGACAIGWREELEVTWASSLRSHNALAPNMLLYWALMERATLAGFKTFDFGRSTPGSGPHRFKLQWGSMDAPLYWCYANRSRRSAVSADSGAFSVAAKVWQRLPLPLATWIGPRLRGGIPA
jgi:FemAB-related protein (PEP-CTERM system-associated)